MVQSKERFSIGFHAGSVKVGLQAEGGAEMAKGILRGIRSIWRTTGKAMAATGSKMAK